MAWHLWLKVNNLSATDPFFNLLPFLSGNKSYP